MSKFNFKVINDSGIIVHVNQIDEEICKLFDLQSKPTQYCTVMVPFEKYCELNGITDINNKQTKWDYQTFVLSRNWFDIINDTIADTVPEYYQLTWKTLFESIIKKYTDISILFNYNKDQNKFTPPTQQFIGEYIQYQFEIFINNIIKIIEYLISKNYTIERI